jgi:hypothetical protein
MSRGARPSRVAESAPLPASGNGNDPKEVERHVGKTCIHTASHPGVFRNDEYVIIQPRYEESCFAEHVG